jgi:hypothetical protein
MRVVTSYFILGVIFLIAGYDTFAISTAGFETSISHVMIEWSYKYPIFTFLMGVVMGHLFWRMSDSAATKKISDFVHESSENSNKDGG